MCYSQPFTAKCSQRYTSTTLYQILCVGKPVALLKTDQCVKFLPVKALQVRSHSHQASTTASLLTLRKFIFSLSMPILTQDDADVDTGKWVSDPFQARLPNAPYSQ